MKKTLFFGLVLGLAITLTIGSLAMARGLQQGGPGERGRLGGQDCPVLAGLTEEEQQKLLQATSEHRDWMYPKKQHMIARHAELNALLASEGTDPAKIEQTRNELAELNQEIFERKLDHKIEMSQEYGIKTRMHGKSPGGKKRSEPGKAAGRNFQKQSR